MCENMLKLPFAKRNFALFGVAKDKNWQEIIRKCNKNFDYWYIAPLNSERTEQPQLITNYLISLGVSAKNIYQLPNIKSAFTQCYQQLTSDDRLVCFGSFLVVEEASHAIQEVRA
jgi:dihydrofolate synthase/folylpolyglutamate synthase